MALVTEKKYVFESGSKHAQAFFELTSLKVDTFCMANRDEVSSHFKIIWIEDGTGTYLVDTNEFSVEGSGLFTLSPGQVFCVKNEKIKKAFQLEFDSEFYCVESHGKEIACNGLLFNNVHKASVISVGEMDKPLFETILKQMIAELEQKGLSLSLIHISEPTRPY